MRTEILSSLVIRCRKLPFVSLLKFLIPQRIRQWAWQTAAASDEITILGSRMYIPAESRNVNLVFDRYEPEVGAKLKELLRPGMTFCDVGANLGVFTLYAARLVGPNGRVFAFEPIPNNYRVLEQNLRRNGVENVQAIQKAVGDLPGEFTIYLSRYCGCHSLVPDPPEATGEKIKIETVRLDSIHGLRTIDFIKVDTEGTELSVLRGLGDLVVPHVILECNTARLNVAGVSGQDFLRELGQMNYKVIENLDDKVLGTTPIVENQQGSWNLYLRHESARQ